MSFKRMKALQSLATEQGVKIVTITEFVIFSRKHEIIT